MSVEAEDYVVPRERAERFLEFLERMASGEFDLRMPFDGSGGFLDAVAYAVNVLAGEIRYAEALKLKEMRVAKEAAEAANRAKSAFLANMSHEIRTPMTAIVGFTELIEDGTLTNEEMAMALRRIRDNGCSLLGLIDDILDLSRVEAGHLRIQSVSFSPNSLIAETVEGLRPIAASRSVSLNLRSSDGVPAELVSDPARFKQILVNLVGNALKFTPSGTVEVALSADGDGIIVDVVDSGIGINPEFHGAVFEPFTQLEDFGSRRYGGTGLGLALSRRIAQSLGGDVLLLRSSPGAGSAFRIRLPAAGQERAGGSGIAASAVSLERMLEGARILLVDDSPDNQYLIRTFLVRSGAEVRVASDGNEALGMFGAFSPDLILLDIQLPGIDGFEVHSRLRAMGYTGPAVALTAHAMTNQREHGIAQGFDEYLTKPISRGELVPRVAALLGRGDCTSPA